MNQNWYANILYCSLSNTHTHMPILIRLFSYAKQSIFSILTGHRWIAMHAEKLQPSVEKDKFSAEQTTWHGKKDCKTREIQQILSQISDRQTSSIQQKVSKVETAAGTLSQTGSCETWKSQDGTDLQHHFIIDQGVLVIIHIIIEYHMAAPGVTELYDQPCCRFREIVQDAGSTDIYTIDWYIPVIDQHCFFSKRSYFILHLYYQNITEIVFYHSSCFFLKIIGALFKVFDYHYYYIFTPACIFPIGLDKVRLSIKVWPELIFLFFFLVI